MSAKTIMVCSQCGSRDCEVTSWVKANGSALSESDSPTTDVYCSVCNTSDAELVPEDESPVSFYLFDSDGNHVDCFGVDDFETIELALEAATDLVLNVWPDPEVAKICASGDEGKTTAIVATVERVEIPPRPHWHGPKTYRIRTRFCQGGEPRVTCHAPVAS